MSPLTLLRAWILVSMLIFSTIHIAAQCAPPAALLLVPPQTSTSLQVKWPVVPGASQYQLRYWETDVPTDKTIVDNCGPFPFILRGLKKNTTYTLEIRSKCGASFSDWSVPITASTINSSANCAVSPIGVDIVAAGTDIQLSWASTGSHTLRYRLGDSGDWLIPPGGLNLMDPFYAITNLSPGTCQIEIKRNCSNTAGNYQRFTVTLGDACTTPTAPSVTPDFSSALVHLPASAGVIGYNIEYRADTLGAWQAAGSNISSPQFHLNPPLMSGTLYQVRLQAICNAGTSAFSAPSTFFTQSTGECLANKNFGKYLNSQELAQLNQRLNTPSPFSFESMIGVNDGGLVFRSYQNESSNQITQLTTQFRNFHTMDEDFDNSLGSYDSNIKPKDTQPEGTPAFTAYNKYLYTLYRLTHGFVNITGATEILQYNPQSWKEKIYKESDWSQAGPAGIMNSYRNYTRKFIEEFAPANGSATQILVSNYQVGNELWDYPMAADYHSLLLGAHDAFVTQYGPKSDGGWKMKLVAGAFQAYRDNTCTSMLRDFSNCNGGLERFDFVGDYLEVANCQLLKDLDAVDCHPYSFLPGTTSWTHPENPLSETGQIRNLAAWLEANQNASTGVLKNTRLWCTEYGFDSNPVTGVGELTQSAYLIRGLLMHSRYHFEKVYFYNAFDVARPSDQYYNGLYNSAGFWKLGTHPLNAAWASPLVQHGATPKPSWFGMLDLKSRFGSHIFHKALVEDSDAYVYLIAKPDSTEPYLVFWSPQSTNDGNINENLSISKSVQWQGALSGMFKLDTTLAQTFASDNQPGQSFEAASITECDVAVIGTFRRNPAFLRLAPCITCANITDPGLITAPNPGSGSSPFDPGLIASSQEATGGQGGPVEYQWQQSTDNQIFTDIPDAHAADFDPPAITETTYYRRAAKRQGCDGYLYSASIKSEVVTAFTCPVVGSFERSPHDKPGCNPDGDHYFELTVNQVLQSDQITLSELPSNGLQISMCRVNGVPQTPTSFFSNLHFVDNATLIWALHPANGSLQNLQLFYCWADGYPDPIGTTQASTKCSGQSVPCSEGDGVNGPEIGAREDNNDQLWSSDFQFSVSPNPGADQLVLRYSGEATPNACFSMVSITGQCLLTRNFVGLDKHEEWAIETSNLPPGIYFVSMQTGAAMKWSVWEKM